MSAVAQRFGSGQSVRRIEDPALVAGKGQFTDDVALAGPDLPEPSALALPACAHRRHRHRRRAGAARRARGLHRRRPGGRRRQAAELAAGAFPRPDGAKAPQTPRHALAVGEVRFVGEAVVAVVGDQPRCRARRPRRGGRRLRRAAHVVHLDDARRRRRAARSGPTPPTTSPPRCATAMPRPCAAAFAQAAHVVALDLVNQRLAPTSMEPRAVLGELRRRQRRLTLRMSSQMPSGVRDTLCNEACSAGPSDKLRVVVGDVGGGFGMKTGAYPEDIVVALLRAHAAAAGEVGVRAQRGVPGRQPRPRHPSAMPSWRSTPTAACSALRVRTDGQRRRLCHHHRRDHPAADRAVGVDQRLRHPDHRLPAAARC